jgi:hypothetical protein
VSLPPPPADAPPAETKPDEAKPAEPEAEKSELVADAPAAEPAREENVAAEAQPSSTTAAPAPAETAPADEKRPDAPKTVSDGERPTWLGMAGQLDDNVYRVAVKSGLYASVPECQRALEQAIEKETKSYVEEYLGAGSSEIIDVPRSYLRSHITKARFSEVVNVSIGPMQQTHALLEFDDDARARFYESWRKAVVNRRLWYVGAGGAIVLGLLSTLYGYLRLDLRTGGAHRGRLQLAATLVALITAAGVLLLQ